MQLRVCADPPPCAHTCVCARACEHRTPHISQLTASHTHTHLTPHTSHLSHTPHISHTHLTPHTSPLLWPLLLIESHAALARCHCVCSLACLRATHCTPCVQYFAPHACDTSHPVRAILCTPCV